MQTISLGPREQGLIDTLPRTVACVEMFSDVSESTIFSIEADIVANAVTERRREFGTVRYCARKALVQIGVPAVPILPDVNGVPRWPNGAVGSMTHCAGYRAAAVAPSGRVLGLGIDAEPNASMPDAARDFILRDEERARLLELTDDYPELHWDRIVFCAKEAVYKTWFPLTRRWLDFEDVSTTVCPNGTFWARLCVPGARVAGVDLDVFAGRWVVGRGLIVATTSVSRRRATVAPTSLAHHELRGRRRAALSDRRVAERGTKWRRPGRAYRAAGSLIARELRHIEGKSPRPCQ